MFKYTQMQNIVTSFIEWNERTIISELREIKDNWQENDFIYCLYRNDLVKDYWEEYKMGILDYFFKFINTLTL